MINKDIIHLLYRKFSHRTPFNAQRLIELAGSQHRLSLNNATLEIGSIAPTAIFHRIPLDHINAVVCFERWIALVLRDSIVFLSRTCSEVSIHIGYMRQSMATRMRHWITALLPQPRLAVL